MANVDGDITKSINLVYVDPEKYQTFENYTVFKNKVKQLDELKDNKDGIILSKQMSLRYTIKQGDYYSSYYR